MPRVSEFYGIVIAMSYNDHEPPHFHAIYGAMFEPLRDPEMFRQASVDPELGTVVWPNGADLSPEFLYQAEAEAVSGRE